MQRTPPVIPGRQVTGLSAVLLPFLGGSEIDWDSWEAHVRRTLDAGLIPAVNMDTGYIHSIDQTTQQEILKRTRTLTGGGPFAAGACVHDAPDVPFEIDACIRQVDLVQSHGGTPVVFPSWGLAQLSDDGIVSAHHEIAQNCDAFIAFELSPQFAPFGRIWPLDVFEQMLKIPQCVGSKHSSLQRIPEWERLILKSRLRPDFHLYTGNDLAIDMICYGSDYLLGLSSFAPDLFAQRDQWWADQDPRFRELNDVLQYLGEFTFRRPVPAYRHSCAQFLHLQGHIRDSTPPAGAPRRPDSDLEVLQKILTRLQDVASR